MSTAVLIEKGIPLPPAQHGRRATDKYAVTRHMEVGDSFFWAERADRNRLMSVARARGIRVSIRNESTGIRVWRTA